MRMLRGKRWTKRELSVLAAVAFLAGLAGVWYHHRYVINRMPTVTYIRMTPVSTSGTRVLVVGGSVAHGWNDDEGGYIVRAFESLSNGQSFEVVNHAAVGDGPVTYAPKFAQDLLKTAPNILVISWGTLDDIFANTPIAKFEQAVREEIELALRNRAVVMVITPPVTRASYTEYQSEEPRYVEAEIAAARAVENPNVYVFDIFHQMKSWLQQHQQPYQAYESDGWHPNAAGHALAGHLLAQDFTDTFGHHPIEYKDGGKSVQLIGEHAKGRETT